MAATKRRTSVIVKVFKGKTPTSRLLSWDTVIAGAFFPQAYVNMPEESVSRQCCGLTHQHGKKQQPSANNRERFKAKPMAAPLAAPRTKANHMPQRVLHFGSGADSRLSTACVYLLALLVYTLVERKVRRALVERWETLPDRPAPSQRPTARTVFQLIGNIAMDIYVVSIAASQGR